MTNHPSTLIGGAEAVLVRETATTIYDHGGGDVLAPAAQKALRRSVEQAATNALRGSAASSIAVSVGRGASLGAVFDGGVAAVEAGVAYHNGDIELEHAALHVAHEAATGAVAAGIGVGVTVAVIALTGGMGAPVAFVIGAGTTAAAKGSLRTLFG